MPRRYRRAASLPRTQPRNALCARPRPPLQRRPNPGPGIGRDLRNAVTAALDTAGIAWAAEATDDGDHLLAAGCYIALHEATGLPSIWEIDTDSNIDAVAAALTGVRVHPHPGPPAWS
jgi:hypothetical protein